MASDQGNTDFSPDPYVAAALSRGNPVVFLDVSIGDSPPERIKLELYASVAPKTVENFRQLCTGQFTVRDGRPLGYKSSEFHRIERDFMIQGGDFVNRDGTGAMSIYGATFPDETFALKHDAVGTLSMANSGPNTQGCQFFITTTPKADWLDGKHVVFGRVLDDDGASLSVVRKLNRIPTHPGSARPRQPVVIVECGEL